MPDFTTELNRIKDLVNGVVSANKALVVDGSKDLSGIHALSVEALSVDAIVIENATMEELISDPAAPGSGYRILYCKDSGLFLRKSSGEIISIFESPAPETLLDNDTTEIIMGDKTVDENVIIEYTAKRTGLGKSVGRIDIINNDSSVLVNSTFEVGDEIGLSFDGHLYGDDIVLDCIVDDANSNDVTFKYDVFKRKI